MITLYCCGCVYDVKCNNNFLINEKYINRNGMIVRIIEGNHGYFCPDCYYSFYDMNDKKIKKEFISRYPNAEVILVSKEI
jgi:heterodisulfide reductase subunit B